MYKHQIKLASNQYGRNNTRYGSLEPTYVSTVGKLGGAAQCAGAGGFGLCQGPGADNL